MPEDKIALYRQARGPIPAEYWQWPLYGRGLGNLGLDGRPVSRPMVAPGPRELLVRHDAVGLCFSDTKVIQTGETHPRLHGRDMKATPVVLGHEVALTVMQVGEELREHFAPGQRYIVQADIVYRGVGLAYGYALLGGLQQYNIVGPEVLEGDGGCYLLPLKDSTGYAQAALTEPWACVTASYDVTYRQRWQPGGSVLIAAGPGALPAYNLGEPYAAGESPRLVVMAGVTGALAHELANRAGRDAFSILALDAPSDETLRRAKAVSPSGGLDDVVMLGADPALYERLEPLASKGALIAIVGTQAMARPVQLDIGRLHYDRITFVGTEASSIAAAYRPVRGQLTPQGRTAFLGAAGPMGQMHLQRALQLKAPPRLLVATNITPGKLRGLADKYADLIASRRDEVEVVFRSTGDQAAEAFNAGLLALTDGAGYDDIVVLAPSAQVVEDAARMLAPDGLLNVFAGLPAGTKVAIDLRDLVAKRLSFTGTSGSSIDDLRAMLQLTESGELNPNFSVVAIAGLSGAREGLEGVMQRRYTGKVVIYPGVLDFPVTPLSDLQARLPRVYDALGPNASWTVAAEEAFLREMLP